MKRRLLAVTLLGCFWVGMALAGDKEVAPKPDAPRDQIPAGAAGFAGMITGKVISKGEDRVLVEVLKIDRTWKHSKAEKPEVLVGKQVTIKIRPQVYAQKGGYPDRVRKFFALLKVGDSDSFDVKYSDAGSLVFLELTKAQIERIEQAGK